MHHSHMDFSIFWVKYALEWKKSGASLCKVDKLAESCTDSWKLILCLRDSDQSNRPISFCYLWAYTINTSGWVSCISEGTALPKIKAIDPGILTKPVNSKPRHFRPGHLDLRYLQWVSQTENIVEPGPLMGNNSRDNTLDFCQCFCSTKSAWSSSCKSIQPTRKCLLMSTQMGECI